MDESQRSTPQFGGFWEESPAHPSPDDIKAAMTEKGGFTRETLASWGVPWPPPAGWRRDLEAQWRDLEQAAGTPQT